jgi:hypothetical protein
MNIMLMIVAVASFAIGQVATGGDPRNRRVRSHEDRRTPAPADGHHRDAAAPFGERQLVEGFPTIRLRRHQPDWSAVAGKRATERPLEEKATAVTLPVCYLSGPTLAGWPVAASHSLTLPSWPAVASR